MFSPKSSNGTIKHYQIHNLLGFQIIDRRSKFLQEFFTITDRYQAFEIGQEPGRKPDLVFILGKFTPDLSDCYILDDEFYIKRDYIYHKREQLKLGGYYSFDASGFNEDQCIVRIDANFHGMPFIPGLVIDFFIFFMLTKLGNSLLHASALEISGKGIIFAGRGGGGKTTIALSGIETGNFRFLGDNFIVCRKGVIYSYITNFNIFNYNLTNAIWRHFSFSDKIIFQFWTLIYQLTRGYIKMFKSFTPKELYSDAIVPQAPLDFHISLIGGKIFSISKVSAGLLIQRLLSNMKLEFFHFCRIIDSYGYLYPTSSLAHHWDKFLETLKENLPDNLECYEIVIPPKITENEIKKILSIVYP